MEVPSVVRSSGPETAREESIFEDDRSTANLLAPSRPQFQRLSSHESKIRESQHTTRIPTGWQFFWWLLTTVLCALIFATIKIYERQGNSTSRQKHTFNIISTALILALGLNFFEAFKSLAKGSQSILLKQTHYSLRERDLISSIENLTAVIRLAWASLIQPRAKPWTALFCIAWIIINLLAQISVAMISLTYSIVDGTNLNDTYTRSGIANAANLTCYAYLPGGTCAEDISNQARANANGEVALGSDCGAYNDTSQILSSKKDYRYYCRKTRYQQEFAYRFNEYNPNDTLKTYPHFTNRIITASSGHCFNYTMVDDPIDISDGIVLYKFTNGTYNGNITIPGQSGAWDGTTYIYGGTKTPQKAEIYACGPRCIWVWAHRARGHGEPSTFYKCPITVSTVSNASNDSQQVSDGMARLAAASIALQGRPSGKDNWKQYQLYSFGLHWEVHFKQPDEVGANMAEFAIGSLATMAYRNPPIRVSSTAVPYLGSHIQVHWNYLIAVLAGISGVHMALFLLNIYATTATTATTVNASG